MRRSVFAVAALAALGVSLQLIAGPLNPPAGPVSSTYKTLGEVEPRTAVNATNTPGDASGMYRIVAPGAYYLTGALAAVPGRHCIVIAADNVVLDLSGFRIGGYPGSLHGIHVEGSHTALVIRNGVVGPMDGMGLNLASATSSVIENVTVTGTHQHGITLGGGSIARGCIASGCGQTGINANSGAMLFSCSARGNAGVGIYGTGGAILEGCSASDNGAGIALDTGAQAVHCSVTASSSEGITGIGACRIEGCTVANNRSHGILMYTGGLVLGNTCSENGYGGVGAGIRLAGNDARVEGNSCLGGDYGVQAVAGGNILVRNSVTGAALASWDLVAGNRCLVVNAASGGAIIGNAGGASLGSTDPNANFTY